jgi:hypothetical protein
MTDEELWIAYAVAKIRTGSQYKDQAVIVADYMLDEHRKRFPLVERARAAPPPQRVQTLR